jgi:hypothetical protein
MRRSSTGTLGGTLVVMLLAISLGSVAKAQPGHSDSDAEKGRRVPVTVAIVGSLGTSSARALIIRQAHGKSEDVIVIPRANANGEQLSAAIFTLLAHRDLKGDTASADATVRVTSSTGPRSWVGRETKQNQAFIDRVLTQRTKNVRGIGPAMSDELFLLPQALKGKSRAGA